MYFNYILFCEVYASFIIQMMIIGSWILMQLSRITQVNKNSKNLGKFNNNIREVQNVPEKRHDVFDHMTEHTSWSALATAYIMHP